MMGSIRDMRFRVDHRRVDTPERQDLVKLACQKIFENGRSVNSNAVKNLLDPLSLTAVEVLVFCFPFVHALIVAS
jgi:hypothetical protein